MGLVTHELNIPGVWEPCPGAITANTFATLLEWGDSVGLSGYWPVTLAT